MRACPIILAAWAASAAALSAVADEVVVKGVTYGDVTVTDVKDGRIFYTTPAGQAVDKPARDVNAVTLKGNADFNQAEKLAGDANAIALYAQVEKKVPAGGWLKRLVRYRRLAALDKLAQFADAVADWLTIVDENPSNPDLLAMAPGNFSAKGSKDMGKAIAALEAKSAKITDKKLAAAVDQLLMSAYEREELKDKEAQLAAKIAGGGSSKPAGDQATGGGSKGGDEVQSFMEIQVKADAMIRANQAAAAASLLESSLGSYNAAELPAGLLLLGKAYAAAAGAAGGDDEKGKALRQAGLALMKVVANYPDATEAPEALYLAGKANEDLGNVRAARNAYDAVVNRYGSSPVAKSAREAIDAMKAKK